MQEAKRVLRELLIRPENKTSFCELNNCAHVEGEQCNYDDAVFQWMNAPTKAQTKVLKLATWCGSFKQDYKRCKAECKCCDYCNRSHRNLEKAIKRLDFEEMVTSLLNEICDRCGSNPMYCHAIRLKKPRRPNNFIGELTENEFCAAIGVGFEEADTSSGYYRRKLAMEFVANLERYWIPNRLILILLRKLGRAPSSLFIRRDGEYFNPLNMALHRNRCSPIKWRARMLTNFMGSQLFYASN